MSLGTEEAHRQQHEIGLQLELAAGDRLERQSAVLARDLDLRPRAASSRGRASSPENRSVEIE